MSSALSFYRWAFTPLSPIHIGTGEVFEPTQYVVEQGDLCEFDTAALSRVLQEKDRRELLQIVTSKDSTDMILAVQRFFLDRKDRLLPITRQGIPLSVGYQELYGSRIGRVTADQGQDRKIFHSLAIKRTAYQLVDGLPYLPGSSVKGAIRTALLHAVNRGRGAQGDRDGLHALQSRLLDYRNDRGSWRLERDPLRQLRIGDAVPGESKIPRRVYQAVNRKKEPLIARSPEQRGTPGRTSPDECLECLLPQNLAFVGSIEIQQLQRTLNGFAGRIPSRSFTMTDIAAACNAFYRQEILSTEIRQMQERGHLDPAWQQAVMSFLEENESLIRAGKGFLLRIGHHVGAEAVTLPGMRRIRIQRRTDPLDHATTWWMAAEQGKGQEGRLLPFGWVFVEVQDASSGSQEWQGKPFSYAVHLPEPVPESAPPPVSAPARWEGRLKYRRQTGTLSTEDGQASATGEAVHKILGSLPAAIQRKLEENQCFYKFLVVIEGKEIVSVEKKS